MRFWDTSALVPLFVAELVKPGCPARCSGATQRSLPGGGPSSSAFQPSPVSNVKAGWRRHRWSKPSHRLDELSMGWREVQPVGRVRQSRVSTGPGPPPAGRRRAFHWGCGHRRRRGAALNPSLRGPRQGDRLAGRAGSRRLRDRPAGPGRLTAGRRTPPTSPRPLLALSRADRRRRRHPAPADQGGRLTPVLRARL